MKAARVDDNPERLLAEAIAWGDLLCKEAFWHEGRCSWLGRSPEESPQEGPVFSASAALGPDLYAGTAGVALFLAQLYAVTARPAHRDTAAGAIRHANHHIANITQDGRLGLHTGITGVGFSTVKVGELLREPALVSQGMELLCGLSAEAGDAPVLDFISGSSGTICALLALHRSTRDDRLRERARALGDDILRRGAADNGVWTWSNADLSGATQWSQMLNGFAHGASGLALALFELHAATGRDEYREAAFGAVAYEDQFLDPKEDNWKDLRAEGEQPVQSDGHTMAWCHGAPGIALARLRAIELLPDRATELRASADIALRGTERHAATQLSAQAFDVTSCHGLAGLAEPFVLASRVLGDSTFLQRARSLWSDALRRREENAVWLSGVGSGGKNHSLMIGMAGAGYGLLRAHDPVQTPSLLLPE